MPRTQVILVALVIIVAGLGGGLLARRTLHQGELPQAAMTAGTLLQPPRPLQPFTLIDQDEQPFDAARLRGQWTLLFFGFTNCPDVCPMTLSALAQIDKQLVDVSPPDRPQIVLVSVDPERDTPATLKSYVKFFSPSFLGVTGTSEQIATVTQAFSVPVAINKSADGAYSVDHSAAIFLVDRDAALRALFSTPHDPSKIAADLRRIIASEQRT
jgi:protein SCO1